jgi:hypothetical protein
MKKSCPSHSITKIKVQTGGEGNYGITGLRDLGNKVMGLRGYGGYGVMTSDFQLPTPSFQLPTSNFLHAHQINHLNHSSDNCTAIKASLVRFALILNLLQ